MGADLDRRVHALAKTQAGAARGAQDYERPDLIPEWSGYMTLLELPQGLCRKIATVASVAIICMIAAVTPRPASATEDVTEVGHTFKDCFTCPEMVVIPAGEFLMGASSQDMLSEIATAGILWKSSMESLKSRSTPQHKVTLSRKFAIGRFDVSKGEYAEFVRATGYTAATSCVTHRNDNYAKHLNTSWQNPDFAQADDDPVVCVSRSDAEAYVRWLNSTLDVTNVWKGLGPYRFPTEDEWEYSARAGSTTARWWGEEIGINYANCRGCGSKVLEATSPGNLSPANHFGVGDVLGNVWQMVADCWHWGYIDSASYDSVWSVDGCTKHVIRGGSWGSETYVIRSATRAWNNDTDPANDVGFRLVKELAQ